MVRWERGSADQLKCAGAAGRIDGMQMCHNPRISHKAGANREAYIELTLLGRPAL